MQNTPKEIVTPLGNKVVIKSFLSYGDLKPALKLEDNFEKSEKMLELALISVNEITDRTAAYNALKDMPISEYTFVMTEIKNIVSGNFIPAK